MTVRVGDLFAGMGGWSLGAITVGATPVWAIDHWQGAVDSYNRNIGNHAICARVEDIDPATLPPIDILCASPPCQGASQARRKDLPAHAEADAGLAVVRYLEVLCPRAFLLENVPPYATTASFKAILACLTRLGYIVHYENVNSADYLVPQTRNRLILRAVRDSLLWPLPAPQRWIGWYAAIADLVPGLPETSFANWQLARLADMPEYSFLLMTGNTNIANPSGNGVLAGVPPANTVCGNSDRARAYLVSGTDSTVRHGTEPSVTVCATLQSKAAMPRALLVHGTDMRTLPVRDGHEPAFTAVCTHGMPRVFLLEGGNAGRPLSPRSGDLPGHTCMNVHKSGYPRAFVVSGTPDDYGTSVCVRDAGNPMFTVQASSEHKPARAQALGRVVKLSLRCLARFQSIPDWYELPARNADAARLIGNAIPARLAQCLLEPFVASMQLEASA